MKSGGLGLTRVYLQRSRTDEVTAAGSRSEAEDEDDEDYVPYVPLRQRRQLLVRALRGRRNEGVGWKVVCGMGVRPQAGGGVLTRDHGPQANGGLATSSKQYDSSLSAGRKTLPKQNPPGPLPCTVLGLALRGARGPSAPEAAAAEAQGSYGGGAARQRQRAPGR